LKLGKNGKTNQNNMGKLRILTRLRLWIGAIGWELFIWGMNTTEEEYWNSMYEWEKSYREQKEDEE
jgi:hypothetical protein